jgi:tetratricopeptide (TPR) repeat protein
MRTWPLFALFIGLVAISVVGCGGSDTFDHTEIQKLYIEAMKVRPTDPAKCVELLTQIIDNKPEEEAYFHRGWIYAKEGSFDKAKADVAAGLDLAPEHPRLVWLDGELKKPADKRNLELLPTDSK